MAVNFKRSLGLPIKGYHDIIVSGKKLVISIEMKKAGLTVPQILSWSSHARQRTCKALKALYILQRNEFFNTSLSNKRGFFKSCVVISYASSLWLPSKSDLTLPKIVQRKGSKWILSGERLSYKNSLLKLEIFPLSLPGTACHPLVCENLDYKN